MQIIDPETGLFASEHFQALLDEQVKSAARQGVHYSVVVCFPQHFSDERSVDAVRAAAVFLKELLRDDDVAGRLDEEILAIGLPNTTVTGARVLTYRLKGDLAARTAHLQVSVWEAGLACLPEDGLTAEELLQTAVDTAKQGRKPRVPGTELPPIPLGFG